MSTNGNIPASDLKDLSTPGRALTPAAASFERLKAYAKSQNKALVGTTQKEHAYRSKAEQVAVLKYNYTTNPKFSTKGYTVANGGIRYYNGQTWYRKPGYATAAVPGTSNHGYGVAIDFQGLGGFNGAMYKWMAVHAGAYGWNNKAGKLIKEPWHWEYVEADDKHKNDKPPAPPSNNTSNAKTETWSDDMERRSTSATNDQPIKKNIWTTVKFDDAGNVSILGKPGAFDALVELTTTGVPRGEELQIRYIKVKASDSGTVTTASYPITEILGSGGSTYGQVSGKGSTAKDERLRVQVLTVSDGVVITNARANVDLFA